MGILIIIFLILGIIAFAGLIKRDKVQCTACFKWNSKSAAKCRNCGKDL